MVTLAASAGTPSPWDSAGSSRCSRCARCSTRSAAARIATARARHPRPRRTRRPPARRPSPRPAAAPPATAPRPAARRAAAEGAAEERAAPHAAPRARVAGRRRRGLEARGADAAAILAAAVLAAPPRSPRRPRALPRRAGPALGPPGDVSLRLGATPPRSGAIPPRFVGFSVEWSLDRALHGSRRAAGVREPPAQPRQRRAADRRQLAGPHAVRAGRAQHGPQHHARGPRAPSAPRSTR